MSAALLVALLAKSSVVAGLGLGLSVVVARRPSDRVDVLRATVCLLLALPVLMTFGPALSVALLPAAPAAAPSPLLWSGALNPVEGVTVSGAILWPSMAEALALAWTIGALLVIGRFAAGVWTLSRWTETGRPVTAEVWTKALRTVAPGISPVLKTSDRIASPLSWGLPPGNVLIDPATLARPQTAAAVMAHEMAHIQRRDWLFLVLSRLVLALFWFNPLIWLLHRSLIERSEEAADAVAVGQVDRHAYARALIGLAAGPGSLAATAMAGDGRSLKRRIATLMTDKTHARRPAVILTAVAVLAAVATPIAALELHSRSVQISDADFMPLPPLPPIPPIPPMPPMPPMPPVPPMPMLAVPAMPADPVELAWGVVAPPAPPAPPLPPAPPALSQSGRYVYTYDGRNWEDMTPGEQARAEEAHQAAAEARQAATEARIEAEQQRRTADIARSQADFDRTQADMARRQADTARIAAEHARAYGVTQAAYGRRVAEQAQAQSRVAMAGARRAQADARVHMREGVVNMRRGAEQLRQESRRLEDPAYRARQIRENAARGNTVTDAELRAAGRRMPGQAADMERRAVELAARAEGQ